MQFLFEIAVTVTVWALCNFLVILALRLCGISLTFRLGKKGWIEREIVLRRLSKPGYVFVNGVLFWGWSFFVGITVSDYVSQRYFGIAHNRWTLTNTALVLLGLSIISALSALNDWNKSVPAENATGSASSC